VVGLVLLLLLKYAALLAIPLELKRPALLLVPALARYTQVLVMARAHAARADGLGACFLAGITNAQLAVASACIIPLAWLLGHIAGVAALTLTIFWGMGAKSYFTRRLGGISGDIVGFSGEIAEVLTLIVITATTTLLTRYP
jgi:adenosylcobinamide-GDP ribazoletransferase